MSSSSKTSRLRLNIWSATDSPLRTDFNNDNSLIDSAVQSIETQLSANTSDHAAIRSEMSNLVSGTSDDLYAYARETRRLVLDSYAAALSADVSPSLDPGTGEVWVEDFTTLTDIDLSAATTARYLMSDDRDESINYFGATAGYHPSLGDTFSRTSDANIALPFTVPESCTIRGLLARPVYSPSFTGDLNVTCKLYRATASGSTYKLGEELFSATKARPTDIPYNETFTDPYVNYVDTPFNLSAGTYCVVFYGTQIRVNNYGRNSVDGNPRLAPYDRLFLLNGGDPTAELTVRTEYYADAAVHWTPTASPYGILNTKLLGFKREAKSAAVYIYSDTNDLQCTCTVLGSSGSGSALAPDDTLKNAPVPGGLYVTKLSGTFAAPLSDMKLRLGLYSPSVGRIKRIQLIAMRTEL